MRPVLIGIIVLALGAIAGWYAVGSPTPTIPGLSQGTTPTDEQEQGMDETTGPSSETGSMPVAEGSSESEKGGVSARTVVTYTNTGFAPQRITVKKGTFVAFINDSTVMMQVAGGAHEDHDRAFEQPQAVGKGGSFEYEFSTVGTFTYHNHDNAAHTGTVVVEE